MTMEANNISTDIVIESSINVVPRVDRFWNAEFISIRIGSRKQMGAPIEAAKVSVPITYSGSS